MWDASRPSFAHWVRMAGKEPLGPHGRGWPREKAASSRSQPPWHHQQAPLREFEGQLELFSGVWGTYFCPAMNKGRRPGGAAGEARVRRPRATGAAHGGELGRSHLERALLPRSRGGSWKKGLWGEPPEHRTQDGA